MSAKRSGGADAFAARARTFFRRVNAEPTGVAAALTVLAAGALVSWLFWTPLGLPAQLIKNVNPLVGDCTGFQPATFAMYLCSMKVAAFTLVGPILLIVAAFYFRKTLREFIARNVPRVPPEARFLVTPLVATVLFALSWAGIHYETGEQIGLVPQTVFPTVVGVFIYAIGRWGPRIQTGLSSFFDQRDRIPMRARIALAFAIPFVVSLSLTAEQRVSNTAFKEQLVVLIGLVTGFLVLAPRRGDVVAGVTEGVARLRTRA